MTSAIILSDNGVTSGSAGIKSSGGSDGTLLLQTTTSGGTATTAVLIDNAQNVGVGVTPSATAFSGSKMMQVGYAGNVLQGITLTNFSMACGAFFNSAGNWQSTGSGYRNTLYSQSDGGHAWYNAAVTSAGSTVSFTQAMTLDASGNFMVGQPSASSKMSVTGTGSSNTGILAINATDTSNPFIWASQAFLSGQTAGQNFIHFIGKSGTTKNSGYIGYKWAGDASASNLLTFGHYGNDNLMNLDSSGNLLVGTTSNAPSPYNNARQYIASSLSGLAVSVTNTGYSLVNFFYNNTTLVGYITTNGTGTTYATASDYRLKEDVVPITGALARVAALKPVTYKWKVDGSAGEGFLAHELAEVCPHAVVGEKDAADEDGNPKYQGIDTSFLVATLTAAIQEQQALIVALREELDAVKAKVGA